MTDFVKAILSLFLTTLIMYTIGFYFLFKPKKSQNIYLRWIEFLHKYNLQPWYQGRKAMATDDNYLPLIRLTGVITMLFASFMGYLLILKIRKG